MPLSCLPATGQPDWECRLLAWIEEFFGVHAIGNHLDLCLVTQALTNHVNVSLDGGHVLKSQGQGYAARELVRVEMCMAGWQEGQENFVKHMPFDQPAQPGNHICVLVFPEAVVQLEVQRFWQTEWSFPLLCCKAFLIGVTCDVFVGKECILWLSMCAGIAVYPWRPSLRFASNEGNH